MNPSDRTLLDRYRTGGDDAAFGVLVNRYLGLVHAVARRVTGNDELARDVAQNTFIRLAQRSALIPPDLELTAWLHRVSRGLAVDLVRTESRRKQRELGSAFIPSAMENSEPEADWTALAPIVDELVDRLPAADRELLLLRFYRNQSHAAIAASLGLTESVARKRAFRAVEKLRVLLGKRGITTSSAALATMLPAHAAPAAPVLLSASVLQAVSGVTPIAASSLTTLLLTVTTSQKIAFAAACLLLIAATGYSLSPDPSAVTGSTHTAISDSPEARDRERPTDRTRRERAVPATAEERLERMKAIMEIASIPERHSQLIAYLDELPRELFDETMRFILQNDRQPRKESTALVSSAWVKMDAAAAIAFSEANPFPFQDLMVKDWTTIDPQAAWAWALNQSSDVLTTGECVLIGIALSSPEELGKMLFTLPHEGYSDWDTGLGHLFDLMVNDPAMAERILEGIPESRRKPVFESIAWSTRDPATAFRLLKKYPEVAQYSWRVLDFQKWANKSGTNPIASLAELPSGELQRSGAVGAIQGTASRDPAQTLALMERYPEAVTDQVRLQVINEFGKTDPALALDQTPQISDETQRLSTVVSQLKSWLENDAEAAEKWLQSHPQPSAVLDQLPSQN